MPAFFGFVPGRSRFGWARVRKPRALGTEARELVRARPKRTHPPDPPNRPRGGEAPRLSRPEITWSSSGLLHVWATRRGSVRSGPARRAPLVLTCLGSRQTGALFGPTHWWNGSPCSRNGGGSVHPRTALLSPCWSPTHGETVSMRSRSASASGVLGAPPRRASGAGPGCGGRGRRARAVGFRSDPPLRGPAPQPPPRGPGKGISEPGRLQPVKPPPRRGNSPGSENIHGSGPG